MKARLICMAQLLICTVVISGWVRPHNHSDVDRPLPLALAALPLEATTDSVDALMQAARDGVTGLTAYERSLTDQIALALTQAMERVTQGSRLDAQLADKLEQIDKTILRIDQAIVELKKQLSRVLAEVQDLEARNASAMKLVESAKAAALAKASIAPISQDRARAAQLNDLIRTNNHTGVSELLKRDLPGANIDVSEITNTNGLLVVFRINGLGHCLSTALQCGGKSYSLR